MFWTPAYEWVKAGVFFFPDAPDRDQPALGAYDALRHDFIRAPPGLVAATFPPGEADHAAPHAPIRPRACERRHRSPDETIAHAERSRRIHLATGPRRADASPASDDLRRH